MVKLFRFVIEDSFRQDVSARRREAVEQFVRECPHYVADTFAGLGG